MQDSGREEEPYFASPVPWMDGDESEDGSEDEEQS